MREAGFEPVVLDPGVDDGDLACAGVSPAGLAMALAHFKAAAGALRADTEGAVVLAADTFVVKAGAVIGKPADADDADRIIRLLCGGCHEVITGVCLIDRRGRRGRPARTLFVDRARVTVGDVPAEARAAYVAGGGWRGKAGAYNLAERLAEGWPIRVAGDPATVMGLPMRRLTPILRSLLGARRSGTPSA